ncbi:hypothetical protein [Oceanospirillum linum]|uniref:Lipoprotein n=1 Tax=Oceanospirillum linum TaxID=966 RepID=A0A1T1HF65_OCELI|nr:hypothetical protein [Oceanospirillum linum]OOV88347.1 hypothetical protein BTA35_0202185 [Oceanospirillum linum]SEF53021.1 hypothetical protein SAMN04489856_101448 [Oleiphilus messinensis]SMP04578.1 hypothetical protein SAMN06264348_101449 [Oceanospirillum linum]
MKLKALAKALLITGAIAGVSACAQMGTAHNSAQEQMQQAKALYEVHHDDGRIYFFYDKSTYAHFLQHGETPYAFKRIASGPNGETLVFGLNGKDKKKRSGVESVDMYDGKLKPDAFYGEMRAEGRIYVFSTLEDMQNVRATGETPYRFTQIGDGPNGETIVYVLNNSNKKQRPDALIAQFKAQYQ